MSDYVGPYSGASNKQLCECIKEMESSGFTVRNSSRLFSLSFEQARRLADSEILSKIKSLSAEGKSADVFATVARERGLVF